MDEIRVWTVEEFLKAEFSDEDILGGRLLQIKGLMLIAGSTEAGKSFLVEQLAYELAVGGEWLGWEVNRPFKVLLLQGEIGDGPFQSRISKFSKHYGRPDKLSVATAYTLRLDHEPNFVRLRGMVSRGGFEVLILDPMRPFHLGDENSSKDMEVYFGQIKRLQDETGVAVVQTHHERKPAKDVPSDLYSIRGSALITDRPDTVLRLSKRGKKDPVWKLEYEKIRNSYSTEKPDSLTMTVAESGLFITESNKFTTNDVNREMGNKEWGWAALQSLLGKKYRVSAGVVGRLMREMEEGGKMVSRSDPEDGRKKLVKKGWG